MAYLATAGKNDRPSSPAMHGVIRRLRRHALGLLFAGLALAPALTTVIDAAAEPRQLTRREKILRDLPRDPTVLINVTYGDLPASTDILNLGKRSTRALERCVSDNVDSQMRRTCAEMLGYLGDPRALPTLQTALQDWEAPVRATVVAVLAKIPDPSSFGPLNKLFARRDEAPHIRGAILQTMGWLGSHDAVRVLRQELHHEPTDKEKKRQGDLRQAAFRGLWTSRHLVARTTLEQDIGYALGSDDDTLVLYGTGAAAEIRSPSFVAPLTKLVDHSNAEIRNKAVYALGVIGNPAAARVLTREMPRVREARMLNNIAFALERLDRKEYEKTITELIGHKQAIIRLNAAFVLGDVKQPQGLPLLAKALEDPSNLVKASAIAAIGKLGVPEGMRPLERFVDHPNPSLRAEAIYALNDLSRGQRIDLVHDRLFASKYARSSRGLDMRRRAALELGRAGDKRARSYLLKCYETNNCPLRSIREYLAQDDGPEVTRRLFLQWAQGSDELASEVARRHPAGMIDLALAGHDAAQSVQWEDELRRSIDLIGEIGRPEHAAVLRPHLRSKQTRLRLHAATALVRLGDEAAAKQLFDDLDNLPAEWLPTFVAVVSRVSQDAAQTALRSELEQRTTSTDTRQALACAAILLHWNPDTGFFRLLDALASKSTLERDLAENTLHRDRSERLTWILRRALARESRPYTRDRLRQLLDGR